LIERVCSWQCVQTMGEKRKRKMEKEEEGKKRATMWKFKRSREQTSGIKVGTTSRAA